MLIALLKVEVIHREFISMNKKQLDVTEMLEVLPQHQLLLRLHL